MGKKRDDERPTDTVRVVTASLDAHLVGPDGKATPEAKRNQLVRELLALYDETGDEVLLEAVRKLNRQRGRPPLLNHATAIRRMQALIQTGHAKSRWEAACIAAEDVRGQSLASTARRLNDEHKKKYGG